MLESLRAHHQFTPAGTNASAIFLKRWRALFLSAGLVDVTADVSGQTTLSPLGLTPMPGAREKFPRVPSLSKPVRAAHSLITADAGYHSEANLAELRRLAIPAMVADGQMRKRDERLAGQCRHKAKPDPLHDKRGVKPQPVRLFRPGEFMLDAQSNSCICPGGQRLYSNGSRCNINGRIGHKFSGTLAGCGPCALRAQCLRHPQRTRVRQVMMFAKGQASPHVATELTRRAIDSEQGRRIYSQRMGTVEPVFANLRYNKRLDRFTLRGRAKVATQWQLYCLVHNIEKLANNGYR